MNAVDLLTELPNAPVSAATPMPSAGEMMPTITPMTIMTTMPETMTVSAALASSWSSDWRMATKPPTMDQIQATKAIRPPTHGMKPRMFEDLRRVREAEARAAPRPGRRCP